MANERMFLLHAPSGYYVPLGKRMGWGWYGVPENLRDRIRKLYELVESQEAEGDQDAFVVAFEGDKRLKYNVISSEIIQRKDFLDETAKSLTRTIPGTTDRNHDASD